MPPRCPRPVARRLVAIALAVLCCTGAAAAAPSSDELRGVRDRLDAQDAALATRLAREQATLAGGRARLDRARADYHAALRGLEIRLRALYVTPEPSPVIEILTGAGVDEVRARLDLLEALGRQDRALVARYRRASAQLRVTEAAARRRKDDLVISRRDLGVERRLVAHRLAAAERRERAQERAAEEARSAALPVAFDPATPFDTAAPADAAHEAPAPSPTDRGLSPGILAGRALPGDAPVDAQTGTPVDAEPAPAGPPATRAEPGVGVLGPASGAPILGSLPTFTAVAGWYGPGFERDRMASGEPYDPAAFSAAHRTLRLGTMLRVAYGGRAVTVRVNDRGPYVRGRDLDLSQAAAAALGLPGTGTVTVQILPGYSARA